MTRTDYELIARAINIRLHEPSAPVECIESYREGVRQVAHSLARRLSEQNPLFSRARFLKEALREKT